jgi:hypothetical protein
MEVSVRFPPKPAATAFEPLQSWHQPIIIPLMTSNVLRLSALAFVVPFVMANRTVPKWQAMRNVSPAVAERCVRAELAKFGYVGVEHGEQPEAGTTRFFLKRSSASHLRIVATIYMDGQRGFSALWMDADSDQLGDDIWRNLRRRCHMH